MGDLLIMRSLYTDPPNQIFGRMHSFNLLFQQPSLPDILSF